MSNKAPIVNIIIAAAGQSRRMGNIAVNKPFLTLANKPLLCRSLDFFESSDLVAGIVVVAAAHELDFCHKILPVQKFTKLIGIIAGGAERQDSVLNGLEFLATGGAGFAYPLVAIHDAARPFLSASLFFELIQTALEYGGSVPGLPVKDTVKLVDKGSVVETLPREQLMAVQTPQVFHFEKLLPAYREASLKHCHGTDDASLFEWFGETVKIVQTNHDNLKITTPTDLLFAEVLAEHENPNDI